VVQGNVLDYSSLESAMQGHDAALCALGHKQVFRPTRILSEGTANVLRAMRTHGVRRFVCETALGLGNSAARMGVYYTFFVIPVILPFYFWDKARQEKVVADSEADWIIVRPGALTNGPKRGGYRHGEHIGSFLKTVRISRADVADFMLNQLTDNTYLKSAPGISP
jgi:nucleoside-diphosphate-sugar epimerase